MDAKMSKTLHYLDAEDDSWSCGGTAKPFNCTGDGSSVTTNKRKVNTCDSEPPSKRQRVENTDTNTGDRTKVQDIRETESKKEVSAEQLTKKKISCEVSPSSSSPSTSQQSNESASSVNTRAKFEAKYRQLAKLGEGGFGSVYAGERKTDNLPVAIKHIPKATAKMLKLETNGRTQEIPLEVLLMLKVAAGPQSVGKSAIVSLLDWYVLDEEILLVLERPVPSKDLFDYVVDNGPMTENEAKNIMKQLVGAAIKMHSEKVFHRDIKKENILIETGSKDPRVWIIDFGCGCFETKRIFSSYSGTTAYAPPEYYTSKLYMPQPTTVWQLGMLLYELLDGYEQWSTPELMSNEIKISSELSQDCQNFLRACLDISPGYRATLEQMQQHPWLK